MIFNPALSFATRKNLVGDRLSHTPRPVQILSPIGKCGMSIHKNGGINA